MNYLTINVPRGIRVVRLFADEGNPTPPAFDSPEYISVTHNLPKKGEICWVKFGEYDQSTGRAIYYPIPYDGKPAWVDRYHDVFVQPTHWMPLKETPIGQKDGMD